MGFVHPRWQMAPSALPRVPFSPSGVQNAIDPVTAWNNCIMEVYAYRVHKAVDT